MPAPTWLLATHLTRRFGGLTAVNDVSLEIKCGEIHALIGTNGAGKSTLINMLSGELRADSGKVELLGRDVSSWSQPHRAQAGLARSYQRTTIFPQFTVLDNCRLAARRGLRTPWRWWENASAQDESTDIAQTSLMKTGLSDLAHLQATALSHGQQRQLEIAICLATRPRVLLLDEPLAGMGDSETQRMLTLLTELRPSHAILLVEHDMDAVFRVSDRITVMVEGSVLASGDAETVRSNRDVQLAYLGGVDLD